MLTNIQVRNFKRLGNVDIELGKSVVLIGPNNSGKTTLLQALALWDFGLRRYLSRREGKKKLKRPGVTINRRDLISVPIPRTELLWRDLRVRKASFSDDGNGGTKNVRIDIVVNGVNKDQYWSCGLEFDYANDESLICRPIRKDGFDEVKVEEAEFTEVPDILQKNLVRIAYLPPMSGLAAVEPKWEEGRINVLLGEGQTAQVLRNLCYQICYSPADNQKTWQKLVNEVKKLFGVTLTPPVHVVERGEVVMGYRERDTELDLSSCGRGLQQTLLLLSYLYTHPQSVLLLDEPDAHLEILRQRQIYQLLTAVADEQGSQLICASHSEVLLNEAVNRSNVVAFVGKPHSLISSQQSSQVRKSLADIGFENYYLAEQVGWILYVEDATDLSILKAFAEKLKHRQALEALEKPFVHYVGTNDPRKVQNHYHGIKEAKPDLVGISIFDRLDRTLPNSEHGLVIYAWKKREIENYICKKSVLLKYPRLDKPDDMFGEIEANHRGQVMQQVIDEIETAYKSLGKPMLESPDIKASDEGLDLVFRKYFEQLKLPLVFRKANYHELVDLLDLAEVDLEITEMLDRIVLVADKAKPVTE